MDGALEAVERVSLAARHDLERLVVVIAASIADRHGKLLRSVSIARCPEFGGGESDWFGLNWHSQSRIVTSGIAVAASALSYRVVGQSLNSWAFRARLVPGR
jgi:hypothetical protein